MLQVDLSSLSGPELRQLLDSTRSRGQADLSYRILQEMADRRERHARDGRGRLLRTRRDVEPRPITLDLGDPLEPRSDPGLIEPADLPPDEPPLTLETAEPPSAPARSRTPPARTRPRRSPWVAAGFAAGLAVGAMVGVGVAEIVSGEPPRAEPPVPTNIPAAPTRLEIAAAPLEAPPAVDAPAEHPAEPPPALEAPSETVSPPATAPEPEPEGAPVHTAEADAAPTRSCAEGTPADQVICETPRLQRLQVDLRRAYARALDAHEDRATLRQRQLAWRDARSEVSDPARLAQLYEQRIRKLNAATLEARGER
ncbi:MAG: hypothetical protein JNK30_17885 [Phenylobacterium sp.]|uniref:hypothetical protein n=1 Tax=Phenylobacterium sp. TaxID=1871053 RepID=UPI001A4B1A50|nr:hypothetical protein [Phenylobacterium sp.]MBL8773258.1 hypothetical protein [Phenylobacterium sp.]